MAICKLDQKQAVASEDNECMILTQYLRLKGLRFSHIAQETPMVTYRNGVRMPNWKTIRRTKAIGINKGVPDYIVMIDKVPNNILLFIEMKREKGGTVSEEQKDWINALNKVSGVSAVVCRGFDEAKKVIDSYVR